MNNIEIKKAVLVVTSSLIVLGFLTFILIAKEISSEYERVIVDFTFFIICLFSIVGIYKTLKSILL